MDITLTRTDYLALDNGDYDYINNKGAKAYASENYEIAIEYYRLAAEMALYYYKKAISVIEHTLDNEYLYPGLYFAVAKEIMPNGMLYCDLQTAYKYLNTAKKGYEMEEKEGIKYHKSAYVEVLKTMENPCFDEIRFLFSDEDDSN